MFHFILFWSSFNLFFFYFYFLLSFYFISLFLFHLQFLPKTISTYVLIHSSVSISITFIYSHVPFYSILVFFQFIFFLFLFSVIILFYFFIPIPSAIFTQNNINLCSYSFQCIHLYNIYLFSCSILFYSGLLSIYFFFIFIFCYHFILFLYSYSICNFYPKQYQLMFLFIPVYPSL